MMIYNHDHDTNVFILILFLACLISISGYLSRMDLVAVTGLVYSIVVVKLRLQGL